ncbi:MAG: DUF2461 domain-containing protein [Reichenbachiella sp.]
MSNYSLKPALTFLNELSNNNNREWFNSNKDNYLTVREEVISFSDELLSELNQFDQIETPTGKKSLHRIYRDVRFSKDKTPYSTYFGGGFKRATAARRGGFYFHIESGNTHIIGGFWGPNAKDLLQIRKQVQQDPDALTNIISSKEFTSHFGQLLGNQLKTAPRGFEKDDPAIELLRYKQYLVRHHFSDQEVLQKDFAQKMAQQFKNMLPFFDYMSDVLTTDLNGFDLNVG